MAGLARRRPLRSRKVWSATDKRNGATTGSDSGAAWRRLREGCRDRAGGRCQAGIPDVCEGRGAHAHHLLLRGQGGPDSLDNLAWLCHSCHGYVHSGKGARFAQLIGLLRRKWSFDLPPWTPDDGVTAHEAWVRRGCPEDVDDA